MQKHGMFSKGLIAILVTILVGCASQKPSCSTVVYRTLSTEEMEHLRQAREHSIATLQTYQIGVTTREKFLSDCWRTVYLTEPLGGVGISNYHTHLNYTNWVVLKCDFTLAYLEVPTPERHGTTPLCTLSFNDLGVLESMHWENGTLPK